MNLNINSLVSGMLSDFGVHPYEPIKIYKCTGQENKRGVVTPLYDDPIDIMAQVYSVSDDILYHSDHTGQNDTTRHFYLDGDCRGIFRPKAKGPDFILYNGQWWEINGTPNDFKAVGWTMVRATLQIDPPQGITP